MDKKKDAVFKKLLEFYNNELEKEIGELKKEQEKEIEDMKKEHGLEIEDLEEYHTSCIEEMRKDFRENVLGDVERTIGDMMDGDKE